MWMFLWGLHVLLVLPPKGKKKKTTACDAMARNEAWRNKIHHHCMCSVLNMLDLLYQHRLVKQMWHSSSEKFYHAGRARRSSACSCSQSLKETNAHVRRCWKERWKACVNLIPSVFFLFLFLQNTADSPQDEMFPCDSKPWLWNYNRNERSMILPLSLDAHAHTKMHFK